MKTTIDLPDDLYRKVKAKSALQGRAVREVTIELYRQWLDRGSESGLSAEEWLENWIRMGEESLSDSPSGSSAREIIEEDRNRLERR